MEDRREWLENEIAEIDAEDRAWDALDRRQQKLSANGNPQCLCYDCAGEGEMPNGKTCQVCKGTGQEQ